MPARRVNERSQIRAVPIKPGRRVCGEQMRNNPAATTTSTTTTATTTTTFTSRVPTVTFMHTASSGVATVALQTLLLLCMSPELGARPLLELIGDIARTQMTTTTTTEIVGKTNAGLRRRRYVQSHEHLMSQFTGGAVLCTSQTGFNLALGPGGSVYGVPHGNDPHARLQRISADAGIILLKGVETGRYLGINGNGRLIATETITEENYFVESMTPEYYTVFKSVKYMDHRWHVALSRRGRAVRNRELVAGVRASGLFMVRPA